MLTSITLQFSENDDLTLPTQGITVFVGPNNAGKSLVLKELEQAFLIHPFPAGLKILKDYDLFWPDEEIIDTELAKYKSFQRKGGPLGEVVLGRISPNGGLESSHIQRDVIFNQLKARDKRWWATQYLRWGAIRLDGRSRFDLTNDKPAGDILEPPNNILAQLFQDDPSRTKVRDLVKDAFKLYFVIDPTKLGQFRIRLSTEKPHDEQSLNEKARAYYRDAVYIKDASDGVQAFTGIVTAVLSGEYHTIMVDEPEAFLHPPLARKLGKSLASLATERGGALMASTHSSDFLMGCIQATKDVRVVRLEYSNGKSRGNMVDPKKLEDLLKRPLMRSANVVSALFYDGVVVTEADNDRAFYSEIYYRLTEVHADYPSILFINAQNKQTIQDIIGPLRQFGVPAVAIPDIDILKDGGKTWMGWLEAARTPQALQTGYATQRAAVEACFKATGKDMTTDGGTDLLKAPDRQAADTLFDTLADYGIFVVRRGELEKWLPKLKVQGKKTNWTIGMLEALGSDPASPDYVKPHAGDVWDFMRRIVKWIQDPSRKGTP